MPCTQPVIKCIYWATIWHTFETIYWILPVNSQE